MQPGSVFFPDRGSIRLSVSALLDEEATSGPGEIAPRAMARGVRTGTLAPNEGTADSTEINYLRAELGETPGESAADCPVGDPERGPDGLVGLCLKEEQFNDLPAAGFEAVEGLGEDVRLFNAFQHVLLTPVREVFLHRFCRFVAAKVSQAAGPHDLSQPSPELSPAPVSGQAFEDPDETLLEHVAGILAFEAEHPGDDGIGVGSVAIHQSTPGVLVALKATGNEQRVGFGFRHPPTVFRLPQWHSARS